LLITGFFFCDSFAGALYGVTARGNERRAIFLGKLDDDRVAFLDVLASTCERFNWICHAYCLMTNHVLCEASHKTCNVKSPLM
jgi:REP element-mobilizing transposase RayT